MINKILERLKRRRYDKAISSPSIESRFTNIYRQNLWFGNKQSRSGAGSTLEATASIRKLLPEFLRKVKATSLVDVGCGDYYWMKEVDLPCEYIGLDIVAEVIEENSQKYANDTRKFYRHNAVEDMLPEQSDIVFCREVLFHLSFEDGKKLIKRVIESKARYFLATTSIELVENRDIRTGQFRNINLLLPPYSLPAYTMTIKDSESVSQDRHLGLWEVQAIKEAISS